MEQAQANVTEPGAVETVTKITANGVTRPKVGTLCGRVWEIADAVSAATGAPAPRSEVIEKAKAEGITEPTAATQHGKWRKFNGLVTAKLTDEEKAAKDAKNAEKDAAAKAEKDTAKAAKAAEKAAAKAEKDAAKAAKLAEKQTAAADVQTGTDPENTDEQTAA